MKAFLITYDLKKAEIDYSRINKVLETFPAWWHYMPNCWLITSDEHPVLIYKKIKPYIDEVDHLLIIEVTQSYYGQLSSTAWDWIRKNIGQSDYRLDLI